MIFVIISLSLTLLIGVDAGKCFLFEVQSCCKGSFRSKTLGNYIVVNDIVFSYPIPSTTSTTTTTAETTASATTTAEKNPSEEDDFDWDIFNLSQKTETGNKIDKTTSYRYFNLYITLTFFFNI